MLASRRSKIRLLRAVVHRSTSDLSRKNQPNTERAPTRVERQRQIQMKARLAEAAKTIRERIGPWTKLEILVAQDVEGFNDLPTDLGWAGSRVRKYY